MYNSPGRPGIRKIIATSNDWFCSSRFSITAGGVVFKHLPVPCAQLSGRAALARRPSPAHDVAISPRLRPSRAWNLIALHGGGRGECRMPNASAASCALGVVEYAHEYSQRRHRKHPAFPTQWFYGLLRALPGDQALLTPSSARRVGVVANLAPASGRQNHTASPSATASARLTLRRVHRIPPNVHDDRDTPLLERRDGDNKSQNYEKQKRLFSSGELDGPISLKGLRKLR